MTPLPDDYNIVGLDVDGYTVRAVSNNINGYIAVNSLRPYFGLGYSLPVGADHRFRFAVDLGATSGRTMLGSFADGKCELQEVNRFANHLVEMNGHFFWDIYELY